MLGIFFFFRPQAVGILIVGGPPPCGAFCQLEELIGDSGAEKAKIIFLQTTLNFNIFSVMTKESFGK